MEWTFGKFGMDPSMFHMNRVVGNFKAIWFRTIIKGARVLSGMLTHMDRTVHILFVIWVIYGSYGPYNIWNMGNIWTPGSRVGCPGGGAPW